MTRRHPLQLALRSLLLFALCALPLAASAQTSTATLSGAVTDPNGAVVPGVTVTVTDPATRLQRTTTTNDAGQFVVPLLPPSKYNLTLEHQGFMTAAINDIVLNVNDERSLRIQMRVGNVSETVNITGEAPLISESPAVGTVIDRRFIENAPLNGRSLQTLLTLTPGVVLTPSAGQFSVNGQRATSNYFMVDGVGANIGIDVSINPLGTSNGSTGGFNALGGTSGLVSVDALQEFRIQTSSYSAEFGRTPGGQVSLVTRSGTNSFHGDIFEYVRNDFFDAADWFVNANPALKKGALRQNDFGGVIGGPIFLPRFGEGGHQPGYNGKNRTFFFFSYEGLRLLVPKTSVANVPSVVLRGQVSAVLQPILNAYPLPTGTTTVDGVGTLPVSFSNPSNLNATSIRIDHRITDKLQAFFRFNDAPSYAANRTLAVVQYLTNDIRTTTGGVTAILNSKLTSNFNMNYSTNRAHGHNVIDNFGGATPLDPGVFFGPPYMPLGSPPFTLDNSNFSFSDLAFSGVIQLGRFQTNTQRQFNLTDNTSWIWGNHDLKFGVDYRDARPVIEPQAMKTLLSFSSASAANLRNSLASVFSLSTNERYIPIFDNLSFYAQDHFKITRKMSLDYGLRWEINFAPKEATGLKPALLADVNNPKTSAATLDRRTPYDTNYGNIAPRLGIAYQLRSAPGRELIARAGAGMFYDLGTGQASGVFAGFPFVASTSKTNVTFPLASNLLVIPTVNPNPPFTGTIFGFPSNLHTPFTAEWNLTFEQALGKDQKISVTYVGNKGQRLLSSTTYVGLNTAVTSGSIPIIGNHGWSSYNAMQLQFQRRLSHGLQALGSYTWSHAIDNGSTELTGFLLKGPADFDIRHVASGAISYDLPFHPASKLLSAVLSRWSVDTLIEAQSALPFDPIGSTRTINLIQAIDRLDLVPGQPIYISDPNAPGGKRLNKAAFANPPAGRLGNLPRNVLRGFPLWQVDATLRREFQIGEGTRLSLRWDVFNLLNHPNFNSFSNPVSGTGLSTSMLASRLGLAPGTGGLNSLYSVGGPRSMQFSAKIIF